jgi:ATP-dependent Zn protease
VSLIIIGHRIFKRTNFSVWHLTKPLTNYWTSDRTSETRDKGKIANLTLHRENLDIDKLWESTSQTNESSRTKKEESKKHILHDKQGDTVNRHTLQNGRTLKEIIREAKNMEEKETNQDNTRITYLAVGISTPLLIITSIFLVTTIKRAMKQRNRNADKNKNVEKSTDTHLNEFLVLK